ncbi:hypothetical protein Hamer_G018502 [Homarus americanus]|uniref:Uncharacterized protein n=1 Tax=Homarus americanus TaxID=6706 RepID=A0A8J5MKH9_HOMAM|nr:hypothetical protein Hamer_G018502 [Homarus americanus]
MGGVDTETATRELQKRQRQEREMEWTQKSKNSLLGATAVPTDISISTSTDDSQEERPGLQAVSNCLYSPSTSAPLPKKMKNIIATPKVAAALARVNLPDKRAKMK